MTKTPNSYAIHWFRRDLRVAGNPGLEHLQKEYSGKVLGLFCFDKEFLSRDDFSANRFQFFLKTLEDLQTQMRTVGGDLICVDTAPENTFKDLFKVLKEKSIPLPSEISFCRDYEPYARKRDEALTNLFHAENITYTTYRDHLLLEPHEIRKPSDGGVYRVYTPFAKQWLKTFQNRDVQKRITNAEDSLNDMKEIISGRTKKRFSLIWEDLLPDTDSFSDKLGKYAKSNEQKVTVPVPEAGVQAVWEKLEEFAPKIKRYDKARDELSKDGTSQFSMFLKNGSLTVPQVIAYFKLKAFSEKKNGCDVFLSELIWREFYYHVLYHFPHVEKTAFQEKYQKLKWKSSKTMFNRWKKGETGYPIVDAAMRQLNTTGWMHNRARMIVASFLTKHLLIDWRWGEQYFMEKLLDGDLAPNNGGWQWAASTGCDAQPYFRIFNPWSQSKKFDPEGKYIKQFVPELEQTEIKNLHAPIEGHEIYPSPIVDHSEARKLALRHYKAAESKRKS